MSSSIRHHSSCPAKPGPSNQPASLNSTGRIRLFSADGDRSALATISLDTTAVDLAKAYDVDSIYLQIGNLFIRNLSSRARPLFILREFLTSLGHTDRTIQTHGTTVRFRHLIAFFLGRPVLQPNSVVRSEILIAACDVRRGKLMHRWSRHKCLLYNGCLRIQKETGEDEVINLSRCRVDVCETRRGRCLRLQTSTSVIVLRFDDQEMLSLWSTRCRQSGHRHTCDLSDRKLTLLPEALLSANPEDIQQLNLRRNSLLARNASNASGAQIGWLDDLTRFTSLTSLDLSSNRLSTFPVSITQLMNLQKLNLASNCIQTIPTNVKLLRRLTSLDLENNWLSQLPTQLGDCDQLVYLNLKFNRIKQIPEEVFFKLSSLVEWSLAGNYIESVTIDQQTLVNRLDLRRTSLCGCFRLPSSCFDQLTFLDIRDNCNVSTVHLTNMPSLQILHCERLQLTSLYLNGQSLTHLHAHHNMLDCLIIMPVPLHLVFIDISYNNFDSLPDWICDLPQIDCLRVNNNRLTSLPERLLGITSMRYLYCKNNKLTSLPDPVESLSLVSCVFHGNQLTELPRDLFRKCSRLRHLNASFNRLTTIPTVSGNIDRNRVNTLRLSGNRLDESIVPILMKMKRLKILDISHNKLRYFDDSALGSLTLLEELNLSSNELTALSSSIFELPVLQVLKAHSNRIRSVPDLSMSSTLQMIDLSNNSLGAVTTSIVTGPSLKQLDLTCNAALNLNSGTLSKNQRKPVALYDIGGQAKDRVQIGFSETSGSRNKLCIRRIHSGDIYGMVDGSMNYELPKMIQSILKKAISSLTNSHDINLSSILLEAHEALEEAGERLGASCILMHIDSKLSISYVGNIGVAVIANGNLEKLTETCELDEDQYDRIRSAGGTVDENNLINGITPNQRQLGFYSLHPIITPKPISKSIAVSREIDYVLIASSAVWEFLSDVQIASMVKKAVNPQVAAKTLQDAVQACDYNGNTCIVVMRLLKPELSFRSSTSSHSGAPILPSPVSVPVVVPPMRAEQCKDLEETTLQKIEQRLEKITEVISKMEDDPPHETPHGISGRQLYDRIAAQEKVSNWVTSPSSFMPPPPPDPASGKHSQLMEELKSKTVLVDAPFSSSAMSSLTPTATESSVATGPVYSNLTSFGGDTEDHPLSWKDATKRTLRRFYEQSEGFEPRSPPSDDVSKIYSPSVERDNEVQIIEDSDLFATLSSSGRNQENTMASPEQIDGSEEEIPEEEHSFPFLAQPEQNQNSGIYSVQKATLERQPGNQGTVYRSFDYYSHTKVGPYDELDTLPPPPMPSFLGFPTTVKSSNQYFEYASPRRRKMSVIEESAETQTSSSEERAPSTSPPPVPANEVPVEARGKSIRSSEVEYMKVICKDALI